MNPKKTKDADTESVDSETSGAVYRLKKPIIYEGRKITEVTIRAEMTGEEYVSALSELDAKIEMSGGLYKPNQLEQSYYVAARACGLPYDAFKTMLAADCTEISRLANAAGGF